MIIDTQFIDTIASILAEYVTHSEISRMSEILNLPIPEANLNKQKRVHNAMGYLLNESQAPLTFKTIVEYIANPLRYTGNTTSWSNLQSQLNIALSLRGLELSDQGKVISSKTSSTLTEAKQRFQTLNARLREMNLHPLVTKHCTPELLQEDYFHAIFEASKGIFHRIRQMTGSSLDSASLIDQCFTSKHPVIIINGNKLETLDEQSDYKGLRNLLFTIAHLYRNSKAHKLKYYNPDNINDAITALTLMSLAQNILDNCSNIRRFDQ